MKTLKKQPQDGPHRKEYQVTLGNTHFILASILTVLVNVSCLAIALKCLQLSDRSLVVFSRPSDNSDKSTCNHEM